jgi:hypothetical protein
VWFALSAHLALLAGVANRERFPLTFGANFLLSLCVQCCMHLSEEFDSETLKRLGKQGGFLLRTYQAEFAKAPTSHATESSRSNLIAVQHTIEQMYGEAAARDVATVVRCEQEIFKPIGRCAQRKSASNSVAGNCSQMNAL